MLTNLSCEIIELGLVSMCVGTIARVGVLLNNYMACLWACGRYQCLVSSPLDVTVSH